MDFFESQDRARRKSGFLIGYFVLAVALMIGSLYAATVGVLVGIGGATQGGVATWWHPEILAVVAAVTLSIVGLGTLYKLWELRGGGEQLAVDLGGRRINPATTDLAERRLLNVVEEMALASGIPVPPVYLLDREGGINAFAAGYTPGDAVIGINRGTLDYLTRDELQGVIAHEFSHILHGDMRLNLRLVGLLHGILLLAIIGYYAMRFGGGSRDSKKGGGQLVLIGLAMFVIGYVGLFFARLIKAGVSRQREYLADASAVQFTRNPLGISGALKKIGGLVGGSVMETAEAETASHMFFGSALRNFWFSPFATHPPLPERVRRIEPDFDGQFPVTHPLREATPPVAATAVPTRRILPGLGEPRAEGRPPRLPLDPVLMLAAVGAPNTTDMAYSRQLIQSLPDQLQAAVRDAFSARAVVFAMLLDDDAAIRQRQLELLQDRLGVPTREETVRLAPLVADQGASGRLPLLEIVQSTLRQLSAEQYRQFRATVEELARADRKISLFEFALQRTLLVRLDRNFFKTPPPRIRYPAMNGLRAEMSVLLSALARPGLAGRTTGALRLHAGRGNAGNRRALELQPARCVLAARRRRGTR